MRDDPGQETIFREAEAIEVLIDIAAIESNLWVDGVVLEAKPSRNPDPVRSEDAEAMLMFVQPVVNLNDEIITRALHFACAEAAQGDMLVTTDGRLIRTVHRTSNPVSFEQHVNNVGARND